MPHPKLKLYHGFVGSFRWAAAKLQRGDIRSIFKLMEILGNSEKRLLLDIIRKSTSQKSRKKNNK